MSTLTGAAKNTRDRSVLMDTARARTADRDHAAPGDVEALLRSVYALTPAKARRKLDEEGAAVIAQTNLRGRLKSSLTRRHTAAVERVVTVYTGHGIGHTWDRPDVAR